MQQASIVRTSMGLLAIVWAMLCIPLSTGAAEEQTVVSGVDGKRLLETTVWESGQVKLSAALLPSPDSLPREVDGVVKVIDTTATQDAVFASGLVYLLSRDGQSVGDLRLGVFGDAQSAKDNFHGQLRYTSLPADEKLSGQIGDLAAAWRHPDVGIVRILFCRENVTVSLGIDLWRHGQQAPDLVVTTAKAIDKALLEALHGVKRGKSVPQASVMAAESVGKKGRNTQMRLRLVVPRADGAGREAQVERWLQGSPQAEAQGNGITATVIHVSGDCVVTSRQVTVD